MSIKRNDVERVSLWNTINSYRENLVHIEQRRRAFYNTLDKNPTYIQIQKNHERLVFEVAQNYEYSRRATTLESKWMSLPEHERHQLNMDMERCVNELLLSFKNERTSVLKSLEDLVATNVPLPGNSLYEFRRCYRLTYANHSNNAVRLARFSSNVDAEAIRLMFGIKVAVDSFTFPERSRSSGLYECAGFVVSVHVDSDIDLELLIWRRKFGLLAPLEEILKACAACGIDYRIFFPMLTIKKPIDISGIDKLAYTRFDQVIDYSREPQ